MSSRSGARGFRIDWDRMQFEAPYVPQDGTPPFFGIARCDDEAYNSDDEWRNSHESLMDFEPDTKTQRMESTSSSDTRLFLPEYKPQAPSPKFAQRGFSMERADTVISLSSDEEDSLIIRSDLLKNSHPFFEAGFSRWSSNQLATPVRIGECLIQYRYELEFDEDGGSLLIGKQYETPAQERKQKLTKAWETFIRHGREAKHPSYDEFQLGTKAEGSLTTKIDGLELSHMVAHKLGFAMLCGYPAKWYRKALWVHGSILHKSSTKLILVIALIKWIHSYSSFTALGPQVERFVLGPKIGKEVVRKYPYTFLRIANRIQGEELFRVALAGTVSDYSDPDYDYMSVDEVPDCDIFTYDGKPKPHANLAHQLGYNYELVYHVSRMRDLVIQRYRRVLEKVLHTNPGEGCGPRGKLVVRIWRGHVSSYTQQDDNYALKALKAMAMPEFEPAAIVASHQRRFSGDDGYLFDSEVRKMVLEDLELLVKAAKQIVVFELGIDWVDELWEQMEVPELAMDVDEFIYPWQVLIGEPTSLTHALDGPSLGED